MNKLKVAAIYISMSFLFGCAAVDLTKDHTGKAPTCEVHKCEMHPEHIKVYGESVYVMHYIEVARNQFPNHGEHLYNNEKGNTPYERDVIDFVCSKCDEAYRKYWSKERF